MHASVPKILLFFLLFTTFVLTQIPPYGENIAASGYQGGDYSQSGGGHNIFANEVCQNYVCLDWLDAQATVYERTSEVGSSVFHDANYLGQAQSSGSYQAQAMGLPYPLPAAGPYGPGLDGLVYGQHLSLNAHATGANFGEAVESYATQNALTQEAVRSSRQYQTFGNQCQNYRCAHKYLNNGVYTYGPTYSAGYGGLNNGAFGIGV
eukprot:TRINITY_DN11258_c0_g1_i2.p1 TRINITY_DN11258_c0_g1~~TRINITY_DN11258_c0_g1_i2.p1  ORF type:complete len:207 (+),score=9.90 TRINITY_DN11258_c0_g1_i2:122-742(+)